MHDSTSDRTRRTGASRGGGKAWMIALLVASVGGAAAGSAQAAVEQAGSATGTSSGTAQELIAAAAAEPSLKASRGSAGRDRGRFFIDDGEGGRLSITGNFQFRYSATLRNAPDAPAGATPEEEPRDFTQGFSNRRVRLVAIGNIDTDTSFRLDLELADGEAVLADAWTGFKINDQWTVRAGQVKLPFLREEIISHVRQLATERSLINSAFTMDLAPAVVAEYSGASWRAAAALSDGIGAANTYYDNRREADIAFSGRVETLLEGTWTQTDQFTAWPGEGPSSALGFAVHAQSGGETGADAPSGATNDRDFVSLTADASKNGSGWNTYAALVGRSIEDGVGVTGGDGRTHQDIGVLLQGGVFLSEQVELFARYGLLIPDSDRGADDLFTEVVVGVNTYIAPKSHAAKLTAEIVWFPSDVAGSSSVVRESARNAVLATDEANEVSLRVQLQTQF